MKQQPNIPYGGLSLAITYVRVILVRKRDLVIINREWVTIYSF